MLDADARVLSPKRESVPPNRYSKRQLQPDLEENLVQTYQLTESQLAVFRVMV